jgi:hypothetical protein
MTTEPTTSSGSPQPVTLPDSLLRAITLLAADPTVPPLAVLEAAILITFGHATFLRRSGRIDPTRVAIPDQQWRTIASALADQPGLGDLARVNLTLDWMNVGPATTTDRTPPSVTVCSGSRPKSRTPRSPPGRPRSPPGPRDLGTGTGLATGG